MKKYLLLILSTFIALHSFSQDTIINSNIAIYFGSSFGSNASFAQSLNSNNCVVSPRASYGSVSANIFIVDDPKCGVFGAVIGEEWSNRKQNEYFLGIQTIWGGWEYMYPVINREILRLLPVIGWSFATTQLNYYPLSTTNISASALFLNNDGSTNLKQMNYFFSIGTYCNCFIAPKVAISAYVKYRLGYNNGKSSGDWKVNDNKTITGLKDFPMSAFCIGIGMAYTIEI